MQTLLINTKSKSELKFVSELLDKLGISSQVLTNEEQEDLGMSVLMKKVDRSKKVSREEVFKKLKR